MGTRSDIIVAMSNGKYARIYCHWDGYLDHNGRILQGHYNSQQRAESLIALGDLSALGEKIGKEHPFNPPSYGTPEYESYHKKYGHWCKAYGRDRGESGTEAELFDSLYAAWPKPDTWTEFTYVWKDGQWWVASADESSQMLVPLSDALTGKVPVTPNIKLPFGYTMGKHAPLAKVN